MSFLNENLAMSHVLHLTRCFSSQTQMLCVPWSVSNKIKMVLYHSKIYPMTSLLQFYLISLALHCKNKGRLKDGKRFKNLQPIINLTTILKNRYNPFQIRLPILFLPHLKPSLSRLLSPLFWLLQILR